MSSLETSNTLAANLATINAAANAAALKAAKPSAFSTALTSVKSKAKLGTFEQEATHIKNTISLKGWQYAIVVIIALSGLAAFVNTYNAWSDIGTNLSACRNTDPLKQELNTQFIVLLIVSCVALVLGIALAWLFRKQSNQRQILTMGIITMGILGIVYAISIKFQDVTNSVKLGVSWTIFILFVIIGFFASSKAKVTVEQ